MLLVPVPKRTQIGRCLIKGTTAEFRIEGRQLKYRAIGASQWEVRRIDSIQPGIELDTIVCR